jgi:hypothetical protein
MLTIEERTEAHKLANLVRADHKSTLGDHLIASALVESNSREKQYQERIAELQAACEATARAGHDNATRYVDDLAKERQAGAGRLARLRAHLEAATGEEHDAAIKDAFRIVDDESAQRLNPEGHRICAAFLVTLTELAEARANLAEIETGVRAIVAGIEAKR